MEKSAVKERKFKVMGIVNITDNSYYSPSRHLGTDGLPDLDFVRRDVVTMLDEGADIIDLGACSTRPGALAVGQEEEWRRLKPVMEMLSCEFSQTVFSVDTYWSSVASKCAGALGADCGNRLIVNDIAAGQRDAEMLRTVAELGLGYVAMHSLGETSDSADYGGDVVKSVAAYFDDFALKARSAGLEDWILDPGFGFNKTVEENWTLLRNMSQLQRPFGGKVREILVGISRKSMLYKPLGIGPEDALPATIEAHKLALSQGADILRVHDVAPAVALCV